MFFDTKSKLKLMHKATFTYYTMNFRLSWSKEIIANVRGVKCLFPL